MEDIDRTGDKISTAPMNFALFRSLGAVLALSTLGFTAGLAAETATVSASTVNVRGRAGFKLGEVITKLSRGDTVTILEEVTLKSPMAGEPAAWLKIALPANTPVWLHSSYVDPATQTINASRLKVRCGPGVNFSVLGFIDKGTTVKEIRRQNDWMEIEPPEGLSAYIAANLVNRQNAGPTTPPSTSPAIAGEPPNSEPVAETATTIPATTETESPAVETPKETPAVTDKTPEIPVGADIGTPPPVTSAANRTPPTSTTIVAEPAPAIGATPAEVGRDLTAEERASRALEQRTRDGQHWVVASEPDDTLLKELPEHRRQVVREGKIRRAMSIQAPGDYILEHTETGLRLNYLYTSSTNIPLKELLGVKVRIKGEEGIDSRWPGTPVLLIKALEVLP